MKKNQLSKTKEKKLTAKQRRFCEEYCIDFNAKKAAIRAGYSKKTAMEQGYQLLQKTSCAAYVTQMQDELQKSAGVSALMTILELKKLAFTDTPDLYDNNGNIKPFEQMTESERACIQEIKVRSYTMNNQVVTESHVKVYSKVAALAEINKMIGGYFAQRIELTGKDGGPIQIEQITGMTVK